LESLHVKKGVAKDPDGRMMLVVEPVLKKMYSRVVSALKFPRGISSLCLSKLKEQLILVLYKLKGISVTGPSFPADCITATEVKH